VPATRSEQRQDDFIGDNEQVRGEYQNWLTRNKLKDTHANAEKFSMERIQRIMREKMLRQPRSELLDHLRAQATPGAPPPPPWPSPNQAPGTMKGGPFQPGQTPTVTPSPGPPGGVPADQSKFWTNERGDRIPAPGQWQRGNQIYERPHSDPITQSKEWVDQATVGTRGIPWSPPPGSFSPPPPPGMFSRPPEPTIEQSPFTPGPGFRSLPPNAPFGNYETNWPGGSMFPYTQPGQEIQPYTYPSPSNPQFAPTGKQASATQSGTTPYPPTISPRQLYNSPMPNPFDNPELFHQWMIINHPEMVPQPRGTDVEPPRPGNLIT
jgi:hypothetical protein